MKRVWIFLLFVPLLAAERIPGLYIVELAGNPAAVEIAKKGRQMASAARESVRAAQARIRSEVERNDAVVVGSVSTVANALIVQIPDAEAPSLASIPGVVRVHQARTVHLLLDHALPLLKVPDAWNLAGGESQAGAGIKIAVIDTGIDQSHPGFQDPALAVPAGYPIVNVPGDEAYTNTKVIVARNYGHDPSPVDIHGHGTAVAMVAAGIRNEGPAATITGVAPKAYLGNYKITSGTNGTSSDATIVRALDDAVADGMDVANISFGGVDASRPADDILVDAVERASAAGMLVVAAAGNEGPDLNTMSSPATAPSAIAVGASENDRIFASAVMVDGIEPALAIPGAGPNPNAALTAPLKDVAQIEPTGMACSELPDASLTGRIALILRGVCTFEQKLINAQKAGAVAGLIYTDAARPDAIIMAVGTATLPSIMVSYTDGVAIKNQLAAVPDAKATLQFTQSAVPSNPNLLASFSSAGPNPDLAIKPDLVAVGDPIYTATETNNSSSDLYDPSGYVLISGTSFSTPLVAGAGAVLKAARPGLTTRQYRSLLINNAQPLLNAAGAALPVQKEGAGLLNLLAAVQGTVSAYPTSVSFGSGSGTVDLSRDVVVSNVGFASDTFSVSVVPLGEGPAPEVSTGTLELAPGASQAITVRLSGTALTPGAHQGYLEIQGAATPSLIRIPYWYAVPTGVPKAVTVLDSTASGTVGRFLTDAILFRITDESGLPMLDANPTVTVLSGDGTVNDVLSIDDQIPGAYTVNITLGATTGSDVFRIQAGDLTQDVTVTATRSRSLP